MAMHILCRTSLYKKMIPVCSCYGTEDGVDYWVVGYDNRQLRVHRYRISPNDYDVYTFPKPIVACMFTPNGMLFVCTSDCIYEWLSIKRQVATEVLTDHTEGTITCLCMDSFHGLGYGTSKGQLVFPQSYKIKLSTLPLVCVACNQNHIFVADASGKVMQLNHNYVLRSYQHNRNIVCMCCAYGKENTIFIAEDTGVVLRLDVSRDSNNILEVITEAIGERVIHMQDEQNDITIMTAHEVM